MVVMKLVLVLVLVLVLLVTLMELNKAQQNIFETFASLSISHSLSEHTRIIS
jgi:flagellar biogenesis protein FliO